MPSHTIIIANWKMHGNMTELQNWAEQLSSLQPPDSVAVIAALPAPYLHVGLPDFIAVAGQDCHTQNSGAFTGDVSAAMLADVGAKYVIVGHSERRQLHGESDAVVQSKAEAAIANGLVPIICVGEDLPTRESGQATDFTARQLQASLPDSDNVIVAYEPLWAIGTGKNATAADAQNMLSHLRGGVSDSVPLLYGGSVTADNAGDYLAEKDVDGVLVGSASMDADKFAAIIKSAS